MSSKKKSQPQDVVANGTVPRRKYTFPEDFDEELKEINLKVEDKTCEVSLGEESSFYSSN